MSYPDTIEYEPSFAEEEALVYRVVIDALKPATSKEDCISSCCYQRWCSERLCPFRLLAKEYIYTKDNR